MAMNVGGNLNVTSTTRTTDTQVGGFSASTTGLDRVAGLYVGDIQAGAVDLNKATFVLNVAGNSVLKGAEINNSNGATLINTQGNVDIGAVQIGKQEQLNLDAKNNYKIAQQQDIGSQISSAGTLAIQGKNITGKAVQFSSQIGNVELLAENDIQLENGLTQSTASSQFAYKSSFGGKNHQLIMPMKRFRRQTKLMPVKM